MFDGEYRSKLAFTELVLHDRHPQKCYILSLSESSRLVKTSNGIARLAVQALKFRTSNSATFSSPLGTIV
jgi:hypothetical protein